MITKDMVIMEIVRKYPETLPVFGQFGMGCLGCSGALHESLEQGAQVHGIDIDKMLKALNNRLKGNEAKN